MATSADTDSHRDNAKSDKANHVLVKGKSGSQPDQSLHVVRSFVESVRNLCSGNGFKFLGVMVEAQDTLIQQVSDQEEALRHSKQEILDLKQSHEKELRGINLGCENFRKDQLDFFCERRLSLEKEREEIQSQVSQLEKEVESANQSVTTSDERFKEAVAEVQQLQKQLLDGRKRVKELETEVAKLSHTVDARDKTIEDLDGSVQTEIQKREQLSAKLGEVEKEQKASEDRSRAVNKELDQIRGYTKNIIHRKGPKAV